MAEDRKAVASGPGTSDTTEYSASKAPETRAAREEPASEEPHDYRLIPGGARGATAEQGMSALDREDVPNHAEAPRLTDFGQVDVTSRID